MEPPLVRKVVPGSHLGTLQIAVRKKSGRRAELHIAVDGISSWARRQLEISQSPITYLDHRACFPRWNGLSELQGWEPALPRVPLKLQKNRWCLKDSKQGHLSGQCLSKQPWKALLSGRHEPTVDVSFSPKTLGKPTTGYPALTDKHLTIPQTPPSRFRTASYRASTGLGCQVDGPYPSKKQRQFRGGVREVSLA